MITRQIKKNVELIELKYIFVEIKVLMDNFNSILDTAQEQNSKLEYRSE